MYNITTQHNFVFTFNTNKIDDTRKKEEHINIFCGLDTRQRDT